MDSVLVEKLPPIATSPLDACRGRGRHTIVPRKKLRVRTPRVISTSSPSVVMIVVVEPPLKVGDNA